MNGTNDDKSTVAGPPTTVNVADGADRNNDHQANMANQATQGSVNPGTLICKMMSSTSTSTSTCSANASNGTCQVKITVNGMMHCSVNAMVHCHISQQSSDEKVYSALIDWEEGANDGLRGEDTRIFDAGPGMEVLGDSTSHGRDSVNVSGHAIPAVLYGIQYAVLFDTEPTELEDLDGC